jgi:hypothetical protein
LSPFLFFRLLPPSFYWSCCCCCALRSVASCLSHYSQHGLNRTRHDCISNSSASLDIRIISHLIICISNPSVYTWILSFILLLRLSQPIT